MVLRVQLLLLLCFAAKLSMLGLVGGFPGREVETDSVTLPVLALAATQNRPVPGIAEKAVSLAQGGEF